MGIRKEEIQSRENTTFWMEFGVYAKGKLHTSRLLVGFSDDAVGWSEEPLGSFSTARFLMNPQFGFQRRCHLNASTPSAKAIFMSHKMYNTMHHCGLYNKTLSKLDYSYRCRPPAILQTVDGDPLQFSY